MSVWCKAVGRPRRVTLVSTADGIDSSTAAGRMVIGVLASMAEFEREPRTLSMRQIVDYSKSGREAAFAVAGVLAAPPPAPAPPEPLPEPPPAPLSNLSDVVDQLAQAGPFTHEQQRQILKQLQSALRSAEPDERRGGSYVLEMFSIRDDIYADVDQGLAQSRLDWTTNQRRHQRSNATFTRTRGGGIRPGPRNRRGGAAQGHRRPRIDGFAKPFAPFLRQISGG